MAQGDVGSSADGSDAVDDAADRLSGLAAVLRVLCDPTRLRLLLLLAGGERDVANLWGTLALPQSTASHHLAELRLAGLVTNRREGKHVYYRLSANARAVGPASIAIECPHFALTLDLRSAVIDITDPARPGPRDERGPTTLRRGDGGTGP